jgi:hypothetical protein
MSTAAAPTSPAEALEMYQTSAGYLADLAAASMSAAARAAGGQAFRQTTQPVAWSEATIRHPAGACGQPARAGWPLGQPVSTTVVPAGSGWPGWKNSSFVHHTWNACGTHTQ